MAVGRTGFWRDSTRERASGRPSDMIIWVMVFVCATVFFIMWEIMHGDKASVGHGMPMDAERLRNLAKEMDRLGAEVALLNAKVNHVSVEDTGTASTDNSADSETVNELRKAVDALRANMDALRHDTQLIGTQLTGRLDAVTQSNVDALGAVLGKLEKVKQAATQAVEQRPTFNAMDNPILEQMRNEIVEHVLALGLVRTDGGATASGDNVPMRVHVADEAVPDGMADAVGCCGGAILLNPHQSHLETVYRMRMEEMAAANVKMYGAGSRPPGGRHEDGPDAHTRSRDLKEFMLCPPKGTPAYLHVCRILRQGMELRVALSVSEPRLLVPYTDPKRDMGYSVMAQFTGVIDGEATRLMASAVGPCCAGGGDAVQGGDSNSTPRLFDVGARFGWYSMLGRALGCRVTSWEADPTAQSFLIYGMWLNRLDDPALFRLRTEILAADPTPRTLFVPNSGLLETASISGMNMDLSTGDFHKVVARAQLLAEVLASDTQAPLCLLRADVEGWEPQVFAGAGDTLSRVRVAHVYLDYTPGVAERATEWGELKRYSAMLQQLVKAGLQGYWLREHISPGLGTHMTAPPFYGAPVLWGTDGSDEAFAKVEGHPLPPVSAARITREHADYLLFQQRLKTSIPEDFAAGSLHRYFGHTTKLWFKRAEGQGEDNWPCPPWFCSVDGTDVTSWSACEVDGKGPDMTVKRWCSRGETSQLVPP
eukprot:jgi/Mesvir1/23205/Mv22668-RA.1